MQLSAEVGADAYMLLTILHDQDKNIAPHRRLELDP